jgi:hypothetical protein
MATIPSRVQGEMAAVENVNLSVWNVLAVSKQRWEGQTIRRRYRRYHCIGRRLWRMSDHAVPVFNRFASRADATIVTAPQCRFVDPRWLSINSNSSSRSTAESWACFGPSSFLAIRRVQKLFWSAAVSTNPNCCDTSFILNQSETSGPGGGYWVAFIVASNLRSFIRYGWLVLGKLDNFTAPVAGYCLHLFRKEISNVKFDHFRHNIIPSTRGPGTLPNQHVHSQNL